MSSKGKGKYPFPAPWGNFQQLIARQAPPGTSPDATRSYILGPGDPRGLGSATLGALNAVGVGNVAPELFVNLLANTYSNTVTNSYASAAYAPAADMVICAQIVSAVDTGITPAGPSIATLTGNGLTWNLIDSQLFSSSAMRISAYYAIVLVGGASIGALTAAFAQNQDYGCSITVVEHANVDTVSSIRQSLKQASTYGTLPSTLTFASTPLANNSLSMLHGTEFDTTFTPRSGMTLIAQGGGAISSLGDVATLWRGNGNDTAVGLTAGSASHNYGAIAVEWNFKAIRGIATPTLGALTGSSVGTVGGTGSTGVLATTLGALTAVGAGSVSVTGTGGVDLGDLTAVGTGAVEVKGTLAVTLEALTGVGAGSVAVTGALARTLGDLTCVGVGTVGSGEVTGVLAATLDPLVVTSSGSVSITGTGAISLGAMNAVGVGSVRITGTLAATLGALAGSGAGDVQVVGALARTLGELIVSGTGSVAVPGALTGTLGTLIVVGAGFVSVNGVLSSTLGELTCVGSGTSPDGAAIGALDATLGDLTVVAAGSVEVRGVAAITLGELGVRPPFTSTVVVTVEPVIFSANFEQPASLTLTTTTEPVIFSLQEN